LQNRARVGRYENVATIVDFPNNGMCAVNWTDFALIGAQPGEEPGFSWLSWGIWGVIFVLVALLVAMMVLYVAYGRLCLQAQLCGARVEYLELYKMMLRGVSPKVILQAKILALRSGLPREKAGAITTQDIAKLHTLGGNVLNVIHAMIIAHYGGIDLGFAQAAAIHLASYDVLEAAKAAVDPRVIHCPLGWSAGQDGFRGITRDGVEFKVRVGLAVRTDLQKLVGRGAEDVLVAQVAGGVVRSIGSRESRQIIEDPDVLGADLLEQGLDIATGYEIVTVNITDIEVGRNVSGQLKQLGTEARIGPAQIGKDESDQLGVTEEIDCVFELDDEEPDTV